MVGKDPQMPDEKVMLEQWKQTIKILHTDATEGDAPGVNATSDWKSTIEVLASAGLIENAGDVKNYFDASFAPAKG
jgi:NitT/TauT family transport system substrate-binding protein